MTTVFVGLLLDNGELVRIECDAKYEDVLHESIENRLKRGDLWCPSQFDGCTATYMGHHVNSVVMSRVVAMM